MEGRNEKQEKISCPSTISFHSPCTMSARYTPLSTSDDSPNTNDAHLHVTDSTNLHRTRSGRSPSPRPKLSLSTVAAEADHGLRSPVLGSASKERFNVQLGRANGVLGRLRRSLWDLYQRNLGLILIAGSTLTGTLMMTVVKLLTNQDATVSDKELETPHLPPAEVSPL